MSLTLTDAQLAYKVFKQFAKHDFARGYYETQQPVRSLYTSGTSACNAVQFGIYKTVQCTSEVAGLDADAFIEAIDKFLELSREQLFEIISNPDTDIGE